MVNTKSISVILPNFNGKHLLEAFIPSTIIALNFSKIDYEFIIIDDCSTDNSIEFISMQYPNFILLRNEKNSGFSFTCNQGIKKASKDLIFLLNSDVKLTENYFENQLNYFDRDNTFGVMGQIMNFDGKKIEDTARFPSYKGAKFKANTFYFIEDGSPTLTTYLSGANALIDRKKLMILNGFNELYSPFYFEDFDLGLRAWKMNWLLFYDHQSICFHQVSATTKTIKKSDFVKIIYHRNSMILQSIHLNGIKRTLWQIQLFSIVLISHLIKGEFWFLKSIKQFLILKNKIQQSRADLDQLQNSLGIKNDLGNIIDNINKSIKNKKITWL